MDLIQYADKRILIARKPAGVVSVNIPGGMPELIRQELGDKTACVRPVHRLDQTVGGAMLFARSVAADRILSKSIAQGSFIKQYLAVVHGTLSISTGRMEDWLFRDRSAHMTYVSQPDMPEAKKAILEYAVLSSTKQLSLLLITLHTGRTHQIRVQLSSRGIPIVGDRKYGLSDEYEWIALWSYRLRFNHPETDKIIDYSLSPPLEAPWTFFDSQLYT